MAHVVRELDLSAYCHNDTTGMIQRVSAVPGLKTSAAFFLFLRANLVASSSGLATPIMDPIASPLSPSPPASPLAASGEPVSAYSTPDDPPPLSTHILESQADKENALRLIADSIAQQRQAAASHLISHPLLLAPLAATLAGTCRYAWGVRQDPGTVLLTSCGVALAYLLAIRYATAGYIQAAEALGWSWLSASGSPNPAPSEQDIIIGRKIGDQLIGALVLRLEPWSPSIAASSHAGAHSPNNQSHSHNHNHSSSKRRSRTSLLRGGRGVVRAWTVKLRYRGRGVGRDLLHEAVCVARERCGRDAEVGFAAEHANSSPVLPELFNAPFRRGERRAAKSLEKVVGQLESARRRRRI
ncbi:hypothetical protein F5Y17DRAFT_170149 [Xylariaceae sp. FL0594]|nr:hypothetical protein F5Y17DRAFT_170149 [Xylariaceae sp. FL0594]